MCFFPLNQYNNVFQLKRKEAQMHINWEKLNLNQQVTHFIKLTVRFSIVIIHVFSLWY